MSWIGPAEDLSWSGSAVETHNRSGAGVGGRVAVGVGAGVGVVAMDGGGGGLSGAIGPHDPAAPAISSAPHKQNALVGLTRAGSRPRIGSLLLSSPQFADLAHEPE